MRVPSVFSPCLNIRVLNREDAANLLHVSHGCIKRRRNGSCYLNKMYATHSAGTRDDTGRAPSAAGSGGQRSAHRVMWPDQDMGENAGFLPTRVFFHWSLAVGAALIGPRFPAPHPLGKPQSPLPMAAPGHRPYSPTKTHLALVQRLAARDRRSAPAAQAAALLKRRKKMPQATF